MILQDGQYYPVTIIDAALVEVGQEGSAKKAIGVEVEDETGRKHEILMFLSPNAAPYTKENLVRFGCIESELSKHGTWLAHIQQTLKGKAATAKAEEYNDRVSLKGLYPTGGRHVEAADSPFGDGLEDLPF